MVEENRVLRSAGVSFEIWRLSCTTPKQFFSKEMESSKHIVHVQHTSVSAEHLAS